MVNRRYLLHLSKQAFSIGQSAIVGPNFTCLLLILTAFIVVSRYQYPCS
jgi:hypothetical protein